MTWEMSLLFKYCINNRLNSTGHVLIFNGTQVQCSPIFFFFFLKRHDTEGPNCSACCGKNVFRLKSNQTINTVRLLTLPFAAKGLVSVFG